MKTVYAIYRNSQGNSNHGVRVANYNVKTSNYLKAAYKKAGIKDAIDGIGLTAYKFNVSDLPTLTDVVATMDPEQITKVYNDVNSRYGKRMTKDEAKRYRAELKAELSKLVVIVKHEKQLNFIEQGLKVNQFINGRYSCGGSTIARITNVTAKTLTVVDLELAVSYEEAEQKVVNGSVDDSAHFIGCDMDVPFKGNEALFIEGSPRKIRQTKYAIRAVDFNTASYTESIHYD